MTENEIKNKWYMCTKVVINPENPGHPFFIDGERATFRKIKSYLPDITLESFVEHFRSATDEELPDEDIKLTPF